MSKLDNIILTYGNAVLDLPKTNDPIGKPVDEAKQQIKELFLEIVGEDEKPSEQELHDNWLLYNTKWNLRAELRQKIEEL